MEVFTLSQILSWSPAAVSTLILIVVWLLIKKVLKSEKAQIEQTNNLHVCIKNDLAEIKADTTKALADIKADTAKALAEIKSSTAKTLEDLNRRVSYLEVEYIRRDTFYRELGGWKDDINRLSGQFSEITKYIIDLWKSKGAL